MDGEVYGLKAKIRAMDERLTHSAVGRYFECEQRSTTMLKELRAGLVCFLTVCYIIPVNSGILSDTGGSCDPATECTPALYNDPNIGASCRFFDDQYMDCVRRFKTNVIASTCIAAMIGTFLMSICARMPLAVAPAMGVNAYFTYTVVGYMATKRVSYKEALAAAFIEGWIFIFITLTGVRGRLVELIPRHIMYATAAGIGCFLAFIGLQQSEGIALVTYDGATLVTLGACPPEYRDHMYQVGDDALTYANICATDGTNPDGSPNWVGKNALGPRSANYACSGGQLRSATTWLGIATGVLMVVLAMKGVKASILIGILFCTFISWIPDSDGRRNAATYFGVRSSIPGGEERFSYFKKGATTPKTSMTAGQLDFGALNTGAVWTALITFLYLDFLDATSTMYAMARLINEQLPGFVNSKGQWPRQLQSMLADGAAIVVGSLMGTSPLTVFAESAVGIREGGRTGITSLVVAAGFGLSMFLSPIFASIPPYATGPALIFVGSMMMEESRNIRWDDPRMAAPAFITLIAMPLTYSIAYGVIGGLVFCIALWLLDAVWETSKVMLGVYGGKKTLRHVWLDTMSHFYVAFDREDVLIRELPGYVPTDPTLHQSGSDSPSHSPAKKAPMTELQNL